MKKLIHSIDKKALIQGTLFIVFFVLISLLASHLIGKESLEKWVIQAGIWGPVVIIFWKILAVIAAPFSGSIAYILAGGLYSTTQAMIYSAIGNFIGITLAFGIGRKRGKKSIRKLMNKKNAEEIEHLVHHLDTKKHFTITRILLFPLEDLINYAAGMSKISYWYFLCISMIMTTLVSLIPILLGNSIIG